MRWAKATCCVLTRLRAYMVTIAPVKVPACAQMGQALALLNTCVKALVQVIRLHKDAARPVKCRPARSTTCLKTASALGLRHMLPAQRPGSAGSNAPFHQRSSSQLQACTGAGMPSPRQTKSTLVLLAASVALGACEHLCATVQAPPMWQRVEVMGMNKWGPLEPGRRASRAISAVAAWLSVGRARQMTLCVVQRTGLW